MFCSKKPKATARSTSSSRQRPLHACGASIIAITNIAYGKTQHINGPIGSSLRRVANLAKFATPFISAMQFQLLAILSFMDDHIITAERISEKVFPPARHVFDKMDELVLTVGTLPMKFDGAVDKLPEIVHNVPLLEWALTLFMSRLNCLVSKVDHYLGLEDSSLKEKTIGVDRDFYEHMNSSSSKSIPMDSLESFPPISEVETEKKGVIEVSPAKGSYKEALERDPNEKKVDDGDHELCEVNNSGGESVEKGNGSGGIGGGNRESEGVVKCQVEKRESTKGGGDHKILTLFDSWLMDDGRF